MNSQIDILIKQLCPKGVEKVNLGVLGSFENIGTDKKIVEGEQMVTLLNYVDVYHHKYIDASIPQMTVSASDKKIQDCTVERGDIFVTPTSETIDDIGHSSVITETIPNAVYSYHIMRFRQHNLNLVTSFYINYYFDSYDVKQQILKKAQGLTRFGLSKDKFASIKIPLPPLAIQQEIVNILDNFTSLIDKIDEEINLRQKQYEYYREKLLVFKDGEVAWKTINSFTNVLRGKRLTKNMLSNENKYPVYHGGNEPIGFYVDANRKANTVMVINVGASAGTVGFCDKEFWSSDGCFCIEKTNDIDDKYMFHTLKIREQKIMSKVRTAGIPTLDNSVIEKLEIPIPSKETQHTIVQTLDKFETLISKLKEERALRQKQYEYYREKLLTF